VLNAVMPYPRSCECDAYRATQGLRKDADMGEQTVLEIGTIRLNWSDWVPWRDVSADNRDGAGVVIPNMIAGVRGPLSRQRG
jgi:hypothetical protein